MQVSRGRPLGVTIIAILVAIGGVLEIIGGLLALVSYPGLAIVTLILGVLALVLAWGLWTLKPWAFWTTVILEAINVIQGIIGLTQRQGASVFGLIVPIIILLYLFMDRNVRAAFRT